ncbi:MAG: prevent-host-death protein [Bacteroidota bacterium]|nr:prevent-host-death protein [Bacteroidota bacterium]
MEIMTVSEFKAHFSDAIKKVIAGEEIRISYGKKKEVVARLVPKSQKPQNKRKIGLLDGKSKVSFTNSFKITEEKFLDL